MKKTAFFVLIFILMLSACSEDESGYSILRRYFPNAFITRKGAELHSAGIEDCNAKTENGKPIQSPYFAMIQGEFTDVEDSIIQYGHCWSLDNPEPFINKKDTASFSRLGERPKGEIGTFVSVIPDLTPETPFYVRSYVVTANGDTGYNKVVFIDTTLSPVNEWFRKSDFSTGTSSAREGSSCFTMYNEIKGYECAYICGGFDGLQIRKDMFEYDPRTDTWQQLFSMNVPRTDAVGISITFFDEDGEKFIRGYVGTGRDLSNSKLSDWYEYNLELNQWYKRENYPRAVCSAVGFNIGQRGYVGTGDAGPEDANILVSEFYSYNPLADTIGGSPWKQTTKFANNENERRKNAIAFVVDNYAFVGMGDQYGVYCNDLWLFAPGDDAHSFGTWIEKESLPDTVPGRTDAVGFTIEQQGYVGMGFDGLNSLQDMWRYDPYNDRWANCADYKTGPNYVAPDPKYIRNAVGFGIENKGYVGLGYKSDDEPAGKYSYELWVYRPW